MGFSSDEVAPRADLGKEMTPAASAEAVKARPRSFKKGHV
jgi:hypothetical protein